MKHHATALGLASLGRYGDSTLVHMSPDEVASLQRLAEAHGHTLTINPETGLPEAFSLGNFLKALAPTVLGAAGTMFGINPLLTASLVGGGTMLGGGSLQQGLMAGLGAYGGANLASSLSGLGGAVGAGANASDVAEALKNKGAAEALRQAGTSSASFHNIGAGLSALKDLGIKEGLSTFAKAAGPSGIMAAMSPIMAASAAEPAKPIPNAATQTNWQFSGDRFNPGTVNPRFGERGQPYFLNRGFTPGPYSSTFQGVTIDQPVQTQQPQQVRPNATLATPSNPYAYVEPTAPYNFADGGEVDPLKPPEFQRTMAPAGPPPQTFTPEQMSGIASAKNQFANMLAGGQGLGALSSGTGLGNYLGNIPTGTTGSGTANTTPPDLSSYLSNVGNKISGTPVPQYLNTDGSVTTGGFNPNVPGPGTYNGPAQGVYGTGVNQAYVDAALKQNTPEWQAYAMKGATESQIPQDIRLINNVTGGDNSMDPADIARVESQIAMSRTGTGSAPESTQAMLDAVKSVSPDAYSQIMADLRGGNVAAIGAPEKAVTHQDQIDWYNQTFGTTPTAPAQTTAPVSNTSTAIPTSSGTSPIDSVYNQLINKINSAPSTAIPTSSGTSPIDSVYNQLINKINNTPAQDTSQYSTDPWADYASAMSGFYGYPMAKGGRVPKFAGGGGIGSMAEYAAGGKLLDGPGDGMSDSIPAVIKGKQPQRAALADGEFVIPADVVSHLGNGSTKAGSRKLYDMMNKVRKARTGRMAQGKQINPDDFLPVKGA